MAQPDFYSSINIHQLPAVCIQQCDRDELEIHITTNTTHSRQQHCFLVSRDREIHRHCSNSNSTACLVDIRDKHRVQGLQFWLLDLIISTSPSAASNRIVRLLLVQSVSARSILPICVHLTFCEAIETAMVNLQAVQAHNATLKSLTSGLVAVFGKFNLLQHAIFSLFKALHITK